MILGGIEVIIKFACIRLLIEAKLKEDSTKYLSIFFTTGFICKIYGTEFEPFTTIVSHTYFSMKEIIGNWWVKNNNLE